MTNVLEQADVICVQFSAKMDFCGTEVVAKITNQYRLKEGVEGVSLSDLQKWVETALKSHFKEAPMEKQHICHDAFSACFVYKVKDHGALLVHVLEGESE